MGRELSKEEIERLFSEGAKKGAEAVCGLGECHACYECSHKNKSSNLFGNKLSADQVCPLSKYNVTLDTSTFAARVKAGKVWERPEQTMHNLFAVCAMCDYVKGASEENGQLSLHISSEDMEKHCFDCPIYQACETINEALAEAGCS